MLVWGMQCANILLYLVVAREFRMSHVQNPTHFEIQFVLHMTPNPLAQGTVATEQLYFAMHSLGPHQTMCSPHPNWLALKLDLLAPRGQREPRTRCCSETKESTRRVV